MQLGAIVDLRRSADAIGTVAEKNFVDIELEDLIFTQLALDDDRQYDFLQLALVSLFRGEEKIARNLHRDGAAATLFLARLRQLHRRPHDRHPVHAGVLIEAIVFRCDKSLL